MNRALAQVLTRLYPRRWRERYGAEFEAMLEEGRGDRRTDIRKSADVVWAALSERLDPTPIQSTGGGVMEQGSGSFVGMLKHPSAFLPMAMSLTGLALVLGHITIYGVAREADEGTAAHLWQLLMAGQMPVLAFFAVKWLPRAPRQTLYVLGLQAGAALAALAPVFYFKL
jgi:hypothetical protein